MKRTFFGLMAFVVSICSSASALTIACNPCPKMPCGNFELGAELLYMRPTVCDLQYAISDARQYVPVSLPLTTTEQVGPEKNAVRINPNHDLGFRLMIGYVFEGGCIDIRAEYQSLHTTTSKRTDPPTFEIDVGNATETVTGGLWASRIYGSNPVQNVTAGEPNPQFINLVMYNATGVATLGGEVNASARAKVKHEYDAVDVQFGSRMRRCNLWVRSFAGVHWTRVDERFDVNYNGTLHPGQIAPTKLASRVLEGSYNRHASTWVVGPRIGVELDYDLACGFGVGARLAVGLLVGGADYNFSQTYKTFSSTAVATVLAERNICIRDGRATVVTPLLDFRVGVNYTWCCNDCFTLITELGYEVRHYDNLLNSGPNMRIDNSISDYTCKSFSLDGFYLAFTVQL